MLWKVSVIVKHQIKGASPALLNFTKIDGETLEAEQKMYASFRPVLGLGYRNAGDNPRECKSFLNYLVHIPAVIPATSRSAERSFSALRRLKTYRRSALGNNVSVTLPLLILKGHIPTL